MCFVSRYCSPRRASVFFSGRNGLARLLSGAVLRDGSISVVPAPAIQPGRRLVAEVLALGRPSPLPLFVSGGSLRSLQRRLCGFMQESELHRSSAFIASSPGAVNKLFLRASTGHKPPSYNEFRYILPNFWALASPNLRHFKEIARIPINAASFRPQPLVPHPSAPQAAHRGPQHFHFSNYGFAPARYAATFALWSASVAANRVAPFASATKYR